MTSDKFKTTPFKHQLDCLNRFGRREFYALISEMGTGKTWIIINDIADLWASGACKAVLVLAPNGVHSNWILKELPKHMPDWVRFRASFWSPTASKKKELETLFDDPFSPDLRMLSMNHEALQTKKGLEFASRFLGCFTNAMIVCDESDAYKNPSAIRTKNLMKLKKLSKYRRIMSGTPINNSPFDAFSQFTFLDDQILGTTSFYAFKGEYADMLQEGNPLLMSIKMKSGSRFTPQIVAKGVNGKPKYKNLDKLHNRIAPHSFRVLKSDCLDLPKKIYKTVYFDLTKEQKEHYIKCKEENRLVFEQEETPFNQLVALTKLTQITSGYYLHPLADEPVRIEGDNPKIDLMINRVRQIVDSGESVIIWARYRAEINDICAALSKEGISYVDYHGGVGSKERTQNIDDFEARRVPVFVGNQQAGGTGITLVAASYVIYFSNNFSLRDRLQSEDRAHRIGQKNNVTYINIVARGTIDEAVVRALESKKDVADMIVDCKNLL